jgi:protein phosphatase
VDPTALRHSAQALSDRGRKRESNEDAFGFLVDLGIFVVCDGMGGAAAGEVASSQAVEQMLRSFSAHAQPWPSHEAAEQAAEEAILAANDAVYRRAEQDPRLAGMGTTLVALVCAGPQAWFLNVGDSRGYLVRDRQLRQITFDHSLVAEQVRLGRMTQEEALRSPVRNIITRALGTRGEVFPDVFELDPEPGDLFLLSSDGLTNELSDAEIQSLLNADRPLDELCKSLIDAANEAGGRDNITCLLVRAEA